MFTVFSMIIILALISGLTTLIGVTLAVFCRNSRKLIAVGIGFSAGIMLWISFFELIPESLSHTSVGNTVMAVLSGVLLISLLHIVIPHRHLERHKEGDEGRLLQAAYLIAFGLILHDLPEGFAMADSYLASPRLGILLATAIALHNIPEEFAMALPIVAVKSRKFLYKVAFLSGLAEPTGAVVGIFVVYVYPSLLAFFLSLAAGAMIFISLHEFMPMARRYNDHIVFFVLGMIASVIIYLFLNIFLPA